MTATAPPPSLESHANRAQGVLRARFTVHGGRTGAADLYQAGGLRLRCPKVGPGLVPDCEAVTINTAGGMVGGDTASLDFTCGPGAAVTITSQSAEKLYRATGRPTRIDTRLVIEPGGRLEWLPQETILFDRVHVERRFAVEMAADARLLLVEAVVFGRLAMGEAVTTGTWRDQWRIRRAGALVFAEAVALDGHIAAQLDRPALGGGARAIATLLMVAPDAEAMLERVRATLADQPCPGGASAWNGMLLVRLLSPSPAALKTTMVMLLATLRGRAAPRVWQ